MMYMKPCRSTFCRYQHGNSATTSSGASNWKMSAMTCGNGFCSFLFLASVDFLPSLLFLPLDDAIDACISAFRMASNLRSRTGASLRSACACSMLVSTCSSPRGGKNWLCVMGSWPCESERSRTGFKKDLTSLDSDSFLRCFWSIR